MSVDARPARVLIVEPDSTLRRALGAIAGRLAQVHASRSFHVARTRLREMAYDLLVTNVRLKDYNGLHLVYLVRLAGAPIHAVVYGNATDLGLASEVRRAGAFYEIAERLPITLPAYISAALPAADRRTSASYDRRTFPRGGRRGWDRYSLEAAAPPLF